MLAEDAALLYGIIGRISKFYFPRKRQQEKAKASQRGGASGSGLDVMEEKDEYERKVSVSGAD